MSQNNQDPETTRALREAEALQAMFAMPGWDVAEATFKVTIAELKDISTLDLSQPDMAQQVRDRINTAAAMEYWLNDLKGRVNNAMYLSSLDKEDKLITRR